MDSETRARWIYQQLIAAYGEPQWRPGADPVNELIGTILSANTTDANSSAAFHNLKARFGDDWDAIRHAPLDEIKDAIRIAGMYNQKAPHIVASLARLEAERGEYSLDFLAEMEAPAALEYLMRFPGVGHKTASIVLLFCFNGASFPVDTHIQRITQRLGLSAAKAGPAQIKAIWESLLPPATFYPLHLNLIRHGHEVCQARLPHCARCVLQEHCDYAAGRGAWAV